MLYMLDGTTAYNCEDRGVEWELQPLEVRLVGLDYDGDENEYGVKVSTVFLGADHGFMDDVPILFETMVTGPAHEWDETSARYSTWDAARIGHLQMCQEYLPQRAWPPDVIPAIGTTRTVPVPKEPTSPHSPPAKRRRVIEI